MRISSILLPTALCLFACQQIQPPVHPFAEGDAAFLRGDFSAAISAYQDIVGEADARKGRIAIAQERSLLEAARKELHMNHPHQALALLDVIEVSDRHGALAEDLRTRSHSRAAHLLVRVGMEYLQNHAYGAAEMSFSEALVWDETSSDASDGLLSVEQKAQDRRDQGQALFYSGLNQLESGKEIQALTSLQHAAFFMGEGDRSESLLRQLSADLAQESRRLAQVYFEGGRIGLAWITLKDADRLAPGNAEVQQQLQSLSEALTAEQKLRDADLHVRAARSEEATALLEEILALTGSRHQKDVASLKDRLVQEEAGLDYARARAFEMDHQVVRASDLYQRIILATEGFGFEDVKLRQSRLQLRIQQAEQFYTEAVAAEEAGDLATARKKYGEAVRQAGDYPNALQKFRTLQ